MQITPAVEEGDEKSLHATLQKLTPYYNLLHIDITDSEFVTFKTLPLDKTVPVLSAYPNASFDFHLMVYDVGKQLNYLRSLSSSLKIRNVFIHHKARPEKTLFKKDSSVFTIGLVINPDEQIKTLVDKYDLLDIEAIQIMTVTPGGQGQKFIKDSLLKIDQLRLMGYTNKIFLDGGINTDTIPHILAHPQKPDGVSIGSYLTRAQNLADHIKKLEVLTKENTESLS